MARKNALVESMLARRGLTREDIAALDTVDPAASVAGLAACADLLAEDVRAGRPIVVYCDFDTDGISAQLVLSASLGALGAWCRPWFADPAAGYGMDASVVDAIAADVPNVSTILTADVGISADAACERARELGIRTVVTDHHQKDSAARSADAWADPSLPEDPYPYTVCGAHVAADLMALLADRLGADEGARTKVRLASAIAGIGARGDSMPCSGPSRRDAKAAVALAKFLLMSEEEDIDDGGVWGSVMLAVRALFRQLTCFEPDGSAKRYPRAAADVDETDIDMRVSPALNSMRRTGGDLEPLKRLLFATDEQGRMEAAAAIAELNEERKRLVEAAMGALAAQDQPFAPYVHIDREGAVGGGICGLVANKIMAVTGSPCLVVSEAGDGILKGSGRAPGGADLRSLLAEQGVAAAGHGPAFGVSVEPGQVELAASIVAGLAAAIAEASAGEGRFDTVDYLVVPGDDSVSDLVAGTDVLAQVQDLCRETARMAPFGPGFSRPVGAVAFTAGDGVELKLMGKEKDHAKWVLPDGTEAVLWGGAEAAAAVGPGESVAVVGEASVNSFFGRTCAQVAGDILLVGEDAESLVASFAEGS